MNDRWKSDRLERDTPSQPPPRGRGGGALERDTPSQPPPRGRGGGALERDAPSQPPPRGRGGGAGLLPRLRGRSGGGRAPQAIAAAALLLLTTPAVAQEQPPRPAEEDLFGGKKDEPPKAEEPKKDEPPPAPAPTPSTPGADTRDELNLGAREGAPKLSEDVPPDNPLVIGGQFYLRAQTSAREEDSPGDWSVSSPSLMDGYFDARPNKRVRGFVLARMVFDPTIPQSFAGVGGFDTGSGAGVMTAPAAARGPRLSLDQMWLRFDLKHTVFVTAGRQHVRWGTARVWNPTDFLHLNRRNPLDVFDARTGTSMLKLHLPWESQGWNFYAYGLTENGGPKLGDLAGAARAEVVLGASELGLGGLFQRHKKPKLAADLSFGLWDFDLYGEMALRYGSEIDRLLYDPDAAVPPGATPQQILDARYPGVYRKSGIKPQVTGGFTYSHQYADKDVWTVGGEYFFNSLGYDDPGVYPGLFARAATNSLSEPPNFFYLGRQYAAVFILVPAPYSWDLVTFNLSTLGNLSDRSFITRLDFSYTLLTHLRFEAFASVHYGHSNGELRLGNADLHLQPGLLDLGVALRVSL